MKKFKILLALVFAILITLIPASTAFAWEVDQSYSSGGIANVNIGPRAFCGQTFVPTLAQLDWIEIYAGDGGGNWLDGELIRVSTGETVATGGTRIGNTWEWYSIIGSGTLVPGEAYQIKTTTSNNIYWKAGTNGYASGTAYYPDPMTERDFWFKTWGTPPESPGGDSDGDGDSDGADSGSSEVGQTPSTNVDFSIDAPDDLKGEDLSSADEAKIKLSWTASETEDIDGYRLFAKTDVDADFALVKETDKNTTEYEDTSVEFEKSYTYMVRSFRDEAESDNSNEVFISPSGKKLKSFAFLTLDKNIWQYWQFWIFIVLLCAIIGFIVWYLIDKKRRKSEIQKPE